MKYVSLKGLILSGVAYVIVGVILSILMPRGIFALLNVECGRDMHSIACQSYIYKHFGPSFLVYAAINAVAIIVSISVLANYSTKNSLKLNYVIYITLNTALAFSYPGTNSIYESSAELILVLVIAGISYKNTASRIHLGGEANESTST